MIRNIGVLILLVNVPGCCWLAKRSCFPACPAPTVVTLEKPCALPPPLHLDLVKTVPCAGPSVACFDAENAGLLAKRESSMKDWIKEARARCEKKKP